MAYLLVNGRAVATPVTLGSPIGEFVTVTSGLKAGSKIISRPLERVRDGIRVKTAEK